MLFYKTLDYILKGCSENQNRTETAWETNALTCSATHPILLEHTTIWSFVNEYLSPHPYADGWLSHYESTLRGIRQARILYEMQANIFCLATHGYSYLNASTGSSFDALLAGYIPKKIPTTAAKRNANNIELKVTTD